MKAFAFAIFLASVAVVVSGCTPEAKNATLEDAEYRDELRGCRVAARGTPDACPSYVACRTKVAAKYHRKFSGVCTDGDE